MWSVASSYELYMGRWSRAVALEFLDWLAAPPGLRWLVIDLDPVEDIDFSAGAALLALRDDLHAKGVSLQLLRASAAVADQLRRYGVLSPQVGTPQLFTSVRDMRHHYEVLADD